MPRPRIDVSRDLIQRFTSTSVASYARKSAGSRKAAPQILEILNVADQADSTGQPRVRRGAGIRSKCFLAVGSYLRMSGSTRI
jgi:hypothetical protein